MSTDAVAETGTVLDRGDTLRLVVSRGEEGVQLELLGPRQLAAGHHLALPAPDRLDPELRGAYYIG